MSRRDGEAPALRRSRFVTFDGRFEATNLHQRPDRYRHLEVDFGRRKRIARGAGLSYAAASFGGDSIVQQMSAFDRLLRFDPERRTITVEGGAPIGPLMQWAARHELCFPIVPGYPTITVGGCIAADVHGKNPLRDGTFANWVESLTLYHPAHGFQTIDRDVNTDEFFATCGGYGLTGLVVDATLRLVQQPAPNVRVRHMPVRSLAEAIEAIDEATDVDFAYSWHDGTARGEDFGCGVLFLGSWTDEANDDDERYRPMSSEQRASWPFPLWTPATARMANSYFRARSLRQSVEIKRPFDASFPFAKQSLYHRFYGRPGLAEAQLLVPDESVHHFIGALKGLVQRLAARLVMMSIKRFRAQSHALGMSGAGSLFALDFVRSAQTDLLLEELDAIVVDTGAQPNVAKDSRLPANVAARTLPAYDSFRKCLVRCDPDRLYESELSRRLEL
jgi:decaprenylphospho-beta-D-ribofuranose 2-oxidase